MTPKDFLYRIRRKWVKLRLQPIRVFCFHQVSESFVPDVYCRPDWIPLSFLKDCVNQLRTEGYEFIPIQEAYTHIKSDFIRTRKYAVLTADDGLLCQADLLPWLGEQHIPITMFFNIKNLDGKTCGWPVMNYFKITNDQDEKFHASRLYCAKEQLFALSSPILSIGMHGISHDRVTELSDEEFANQLDVCHEELSKHPSFIPYFAYPYGAHSASKDNQVREKGFVPVLADGEVNYNDVLYVHREIFEYLYKCQNQQS